ncbi:unnamed protein product [Paramecium octaurelia]|uniref:Ubiquitin-like domain-containing protein n=1 Tax=Paramecium octaurelia TaxID=43137 RepID=A0A8S1U290_PAROT|nr:unnamed protein product [Paramecium octaurelia]
MNVKVVSTSSIERDFSIKGTNFGDLIDELEGNSKFQDYQFIYNGNLLSNIAKGTKLQNICQDNGGSIQIQKKQIDNPSKIQPNPTSIPIPKTIVPLVDQSPPPQPQPNDVWTTMVQPTGNEIPPPNSNSQIHPVIPPQPKPNFVISGSTIGNSGFLPPNPVPSNYNPQKNVPQPAAFTPPFLQQPTKIPNQFPINQPPIIQPTIIQPPQSLRKEVPYRAQINDEQKIINDYRIKITDKGNRVELINEKYDMKAVFLEENANEKIQTEIKSQLTKDLYAQDIKLVVKCLVGEQNQSTKVIFKKNLDGIAIQWATGLITLFDFDLAI